MTSDPRLAALVRAIPPRMDISNLREYFFDFIERGDVFSRFHFMAAKDFDANPLTSTTPLTSTSTKTSPLCALALFQSEKTLKLFYSIVNGREWETKRGEKLGTVCVVDPIGLELEKKPERTREYKEFLLNKIKESSPPPPAIPQGNVGTPLRVLRESIKRCLVPSSALQKMGIDFRGSIESLKQPKYNRVDHLYRRFTAKDDIPGLDQVIEEERAAEVESLSDDVEEWDRWEALHGDEEDEEEHYLYEEKIEKKWEKGGSGLVHYTDAIHWNKEKGEKDEQEMLKEHGDDWAIDRGASEKGGVYPLTGLSEEAEAALRSVRVKKLKAANKRTREEKDAEALFTERSRKRAKLLEGMEGPPTPPKARSSSFSDFDLFTQPSKPAIGKAYLESFGWREGEPIGSGSVSPVSLEAVVERRGVGYVVPAPGKPYKSLINKDLHERFRKPDS